MIELPRRLLQAAEIAQRGVLHFGTNDLTQMTLGLSRDDSGQVPRRLSQGRIFQADPFQSLDQTGVGELIGIAVQRGRQTRADIKVGICGEHGGDPASVGFCDRAGLDYVSSPLIRVRSPVSPPRAAWRQRRVGQPLAALCHGGKAALARAGPGRGRHPTPGDAGAP